MDICKGIYYIYQAVCGIAEFSLDDYSKQCYCFTNPRFRGSVRVYRTNTGGNALESSSAEAKIGGYISDNIYCNL